MDFRLIYAIFLTLLPITELRVGLPLAIIYAKDTGMPIILVFFLIVLVNVLLIFLIFFFLDRIHHLLLNLRLYRKSFYFYLSKIQKKVDRFEKKYSELGFFALVLFVAIPLPGTGAWSGCIMAWILGLDRKKSIMAIIAGVMIAGLLVFLGTLGIINFFF